MAAVNPWKIDIYFCDNRRLVKRAVFNTLVGSFFFATEQEAEDYYVDYNQGLTADSITIALPPVFDDEGAIKREWTILIDAVITIEHRNRRKVLTTAYPIPI